MKTCFKCERHLSLSEFYKHAAMTDGYLNKCKDCTKQDTKANYRRNHGYYREYDRLRQQQPERRARQNLQGKKHQARNPEKFKARYSVGNAVRDGRLQKKPCEACGTTERVQGHHEDYGKPLEVRWLCVTCHHREHAARRQESAQLVALP